ncbi:MAG: hypothetical protein MHPSP_003679 [Paramarteilia canceri]
MNALLIYTESGTPQLILKTRGTKHGALVAKNVKKQLTFCEANFLQNLNVLTIQLDSKEKRTLEKNELFFIRPDLIGLMKIYSKLREVFIIKTETLPLTEKVFLLQN